MMVNPFFHKQILNHSFVHGFFKSLIQEQKMFQKKIRAKFVIFLNERSHIIKSCGFVPIINDYNLKNMSFTENVFFMMPISDI